VLVSVPHSSYQRNVMCKVTESTLYCHSSYCSLPTIAILVQHMQCVALAASTGIAWPATVTGKCDPLPLATQCGLRLEV
jgi:hypothetical protein